MRKHYTSTTYNSFTVAGNANGIITVSMNAATSANITGGRYVWDLELVSSGNVARVSLRHLQLHVNQVEVVLND